MCRSAWPGSGARRHYDTPDCGGGREATSLMRHGMSLPARERKPHAPSDRDRCVAKEWIGTHGLWAAHAGINAHPALQGVGAGKSVQGNRDPRMCQRGCSRSEATHMGMVRHIVESNMAHGRRMPALLRIHLRGEGWGMEVNT
jgi:hypothetical protein